MDDYSNGADEAESEEESPVMAAEASPVCIDPACGLDDETRLRETVRRVYGTFEAYRDCDERLAIEMQWRMIRDQYFAERISNSPFEYQIRETYRQARTTIANVINVMLPESEEFFKFTARQPGFDDDAEGATVILQDMLERWGSIEEVRACIENAIIYGTGYTLEAWREYQHTHYKPQLAFGDQDEEIWERETTEIIQRAACVESVAPWNVYSHPSVQNIKFSPYSFVRRGLSVGDMKTLVREGLADGKAVQEAIKCGGGQMTSQGNPVRRDDQSFLENDDETFEWIIAYDRSGYEYWIIEGKHIIRAMVIKNGIIPLTSWQNDPHTDVHWGVGDPLIIMAEQDILNQVASMWVKGLWLSLCRFMIKPHMKDRWDSQTIKPGSYVVMDEAGDVMPIPTNNASFELKTMMEWVIANMQAATGSTKEIGGTTNESTATAVVTLKQSASVRFQDKIRLFVPRMKEMLRGLYDICARHEQDEYDFRIAGAEGGKVWKHYNPEVFTPNVDVKVELGSLAGPESIMQLLELLKAAMTGTVINPVELWREILKGMGLKNVKRFFTDSPNQQGNALKECEMLQTTGIIADPKPTDDHQTHLAIHSMVLMQVGQQLHPDWSARLQAHIAIHQAYINQMMQAQAQMSLMAPTDEGNQATPIGNVANNRANATLNMGARGAAQQAPMPEVAA